MDRQNLKKNLKEMKRLAIKNWGHDYKKRPPVDPFDPIDTISCVEGLVNGKLDIANHPHIESNIRVALELLKGNNVMIPQEGKEPLMFFPDERP